MLEIANDKTKDMDTRFQANFLILKVTFKFICFVVIWHNVLDKINVISKMLQSPNFNVSEAMKHLRILINDLNQYRSDESFKNVINSAIDITKLIELILPDDVRQKKNFF